MMSDLACCRPEEIKPSMLLITKTTAAEQASRSQNLNFMIRACIEMSAAHFREAVYILTEIISGDAGDGSDAVLGVNLSRTLAVPDPERLEGAPKRATLRKYQMKGIEVQWMNGGPCQPRVVTAIVPVEHLPAARRAELCVRHAVRQLVEGEDSIFWGTLPAVLACAEEEAALAAAAGRGHTLKVLAWAGLAQWSRIQLLGEIARGSWGWCYAKAGDINSAIEAGNPGAANLWSSMRYADRLRWAPDNELSRDYEERFRLMRRLGVAPDRDDDEGDVDIVAARDVAGGAFPLEASRSSRREGSRGARARAMIQERARACVPQ